MGTSKATTTARLTRILENSGPAGKAFLKTFGTEKGLKTSRILIDQVAGKMGVRNFSREYPTEARLLLARTAQITSARFLQERITNRTGSGIKQYAKRTLMTQTENLIRRSMTPEQRSAMGREKRETATLKKLQMEELRKAKNW